MIYKLEKGLEFDYVKNIKGKEVRKTFVVDEVQENGTIIAICKKDKRLKVFSRQELKKCVRHKNITDKKKSAITIAIAVLEKENRPIHINELIKLIFQYGYVIPRGGQTFKNTISTSLNNECRKVNARIKKVQSAVYACINCDKEYIGK